MIKSLRVENFRSIKELTLSPRRNNVFVGPNAAGKSNILDVLRFLSSLAVFGLSRTFMNRFGYSEVAWKGKDAGPIHVVIEADLEAGVGGHQNTEYEIEIDGTAAGLLAVKKETLVIDVDGRKVPLVDFAMGRGEARHTDGSKAFDASGNPAESALEYRIPNWDGTRFKNYLASWQFHALAPHVMKQIVAASRADFLAERGDNLAAWLATLKTSYSESFAQIERVAKDAFPGLQEAHS